MEAPTADVAPDVGELSRILDARILDAATTDVDTVAENLVADVIADVVADDATDTITDDAADIIAAVTAPGLTDEQMAILEFERRWWRQAGAKEQAIRDRFEISPTRYYQRLNALLDVPDALAYDATLINRLRRLRATGPRGRRLGPPPDPAG